MEEGRGGNYMFVSFSVLPLETGCVCRFEGERGLRDLW